MADIPTKSATVKVSNLSLTASKQDIVDFFSFSGEIEHVELQRDGEALQLAFVTFKEHAAVETALLLTGATIAGQAVHIVPAGEQEAWHPKTSSSYKSQERLQTAITNMLERGFILGKDTMNMAKAFDEKHQLTASASATMSSLDKKIGLSDKINTGSAAINQRVRSADEKFQISEKAKQAFLTAGQTAVEAGSTLKKNKYILTGASWVSGAFSKVVKATNDVSQKTKEQMQSSQAARK